MLFSQRVKKYQTYLNETDEDIVDYIAQHKRQIVSLPIQKVAQELLISPNAIMRLSKKLGYSGFAELKFAVQNEAVETEKTLSSQLMDRLPVNIVKTLDVLDEEILKQVAKVMLNARSCIFAGVGDSTYFCEMLGKNLRCLDCNVQYYQQIHDMIYAVEHGNPQDILFVISASGEQERLIELTRKAHKKGMIVIGVTHFSKNTLSEQADFNLYFWGERREVGGYNVTDRSGLMMLLRLLSEEFWRLYMEKK